MASQRCLFVGRDKKKLHLQDILWDCQWSLQEACLCEKRGLGRKTQEKLYLILGLSEAISCSPLPNETSEKELGAPQLPSSCDGVGGGLVTECSRDYKRINKPPCHHHLLFYCSAFFVAFFFGRGAKVEEIK